MTKSQMEEMGLQTICNNELNSINGGIIIAFKLAASYVAYQMLTNPQAHLDAFVEGWKAAGDTGS